MIHLHDCVCHDESSVWCGRDWPWGPNDDSTSDVDIATCRECLMEAALYGSACNQRLLEVTLKPQVSG